jgi:hypothetical protein
MGAGRVQSRLLVVGVILFVAFVVGGVLLVRVDPDTEDATCGPATQQEADAVRHQLEQRYWADGEVTDETAFQGTSVESNDGDSFVVFGLLLPGTDRSDYPQCVDDVPVQWMFGGPFSAN